MMLQAVFSYSFGAQDFYAKLDELNIDTQIILLPADNEGVIAENFYAVNNDNFGLMNWRSLVYFLKSDCGLTNWDLNQAADDWHANALSGYAAATMIYYAFYEEMPAVLTVTHNKLMAGYYISGSSIMPYTFSMRGTEQEKNQRFSVIRNAAMQIVDNYGYSYPLN